MPHKYVLGDYISRESVYVLYDKSQCIYVGETTTGRAGVAGRIKEHLWNANNKKKRTGILHEEINNPNKPADWYLNWSLEIYSLSECIKKTNTRLTTIKDAEDAMIKLLKPICNLK